MEKIKLEAHVPLKHVKSILTYFYGFLKFLLRPQEENIALIK